MGENSGKFQLLLSVGIFFHFIWFLIFSLAPASILSSLAIPEPHGFYLRMFGIFPLSFAVLFVLAKKDVVKNLAIIKGGIIAGSLVIISFLILTFTAEVEPGWFLWLSTATLFVFYVLVTMLKPKSE